MVPGAFGSHLAEALALFHVQDHSAPGRDLLDTMSIILKIGAC